MSVLEQLKITALFKVYFLFLRTMLELSDENCKSLSCRELSWRWSFYASWVGLLPRIPYENNNDARRKLWIKPLSRLIWGLVRALFRDQNISL